MTEEKNKKQKEKRKIDLIGFFRDDAKKGKTIDEGKFLGLSKTHQLILVSGIGVIILVFAALLIGSAKFYGLFLGMAVIVGFIPYSLRVYFRKQRLVKWEDNLPALLRDIAEARKSGMTLPQAVYKSAKVDYGELNPEVKRMANQISWGVPFNEVLTSFAKRSKSRFIERAIAIIVEAQVSGGALTDTLDAVARDASMIKELEKERKTRLNQQVVVMYSIFFLFIAIVVALQRLMIPLITSRGFSLASESPEEVLFFYRNLFFSMIVIQAIFNGMLAGQIGEGSAVIGLKHSAVFLVVGVVISVMFIF
ncbi:MAG: type II secretion system F family protein [archaeon]